MQQASCLEGGPLLWIYLHVNKKSDDDDDDEWLQCQRSEFIKSCISINKAFLKYLLTEKGHTSNKTLMISAAMLLQTVKIETDKAKYGSYLALSISVEILFV